MPFRTDFGSKNFRHRYPQVNAYVGLKLCDYLGLETGYFASNELSRDAFFDINDRNLGDITADPTRSIGSSRIQGWHLNAVGYVPLNMYCLTAFAYVGVSNSKIVLRDIITEIAGIPGSLTTNFSQTKTILRAGTGLQYMITNCIGVRGLVGWENTSKFNKITSNQAEVLAKLKDSVLLSFGIFARF